MKINDLLENRNREIVQSLVDPAAQDRLRMQRQRLFKGRQGKDNGVIRNPELGNAAASGINQKNQHLRMVSQVDRFDDPISIVKQALNTGSTPEEVLAALPQGYDLGTAPSANQVAQQRANDPHLQRGPDVREGDNFGMSSQQRKLANLGRVLMDQATTTKDDELSNVMAKVGNELTNFGATFGPKNLNDLVKKTDTPAPVIQKLLAYADKILTAQNKIKADHKDGGLNDSMYENNAGSIAAVAAPVGGMISRNNTGKNGLDSDNLMGGPKKKKKKSSRSN